MDFDKASLRLNTGTTQGGTIERLYEEVQDSVKKNKALEIGGATVAAVVGIALLAKRAIPLNAELLPAVASQASSEALPALTALTESAAEETKVEGLAALKLNPGNPSIKVAIPELGTIHDFTDGHRYWGHNYDFQQFEAGYKARFTGWASTEIKPGDAILISNKRGSGSALYRIDKINYERDPADMFFADASFFPASTCPGGLKISKGMMCP